MASGIEMAAKRPSSNEERDNRVFKAMANADRRQILDLLRDSRHTTGQVCDHLPSLNRCTVMQHLGVLEKAGLIISRKEGRCRWHYLDVSPIQRIYERWIRDYAMPASDFLLRLKTDLES
jgi:DNA-binding transcriptional ArsR family regulator